MGAGPDRRHPSAPGGVLLSKAGPTKDSVHELRALARSYGVQSGYRDTRGRRRIASVPALMAVLKALGAPIERVGDAPEVLRARRQDHGLRVLQPVTVAWDGKPPVIALRLPVGRTRHPIDCSIEFDDPDLEPIRWISGMASGEAVSSLIDVEGASYANVALDVPLRRLPFGHHRLTVEASGATASALVVSAPRRCPKPGGGGRHPSWGAFIPLYALRSERSWGAGDFTDLDRLVKWASDLGSGVVATLPLLAAFLDEPFEHSPYSPASRLFWNEVFLDVTAIPELEVSPPARALLQSAPIRGEVARLQATDLVDYRGMAVLKRRVLEELARSFFATPSARREAFDRWLEANPAAVDYAQFRAACERRRAPWPTWPAHEREGALPARGSPRERLARRYHTYVQWLAAEQLQGVAGGPSGRHAGLCFDLPLGVHPAGYDVWREREAFAPGVSAGAPPDTFFSGGQDWGFPPLHPERIRDQGYRYPIACLRHALRHAAVLRVDHVMALHRLYWVPHGLPAHEGVYVRYPAEELYAILSLEASRTGTVVAGEDLGTVPAKVRQALRRHGLLRSHVLQFELEPNRHAALRPPPPDALASLGTHDTPPFASFWRGLDIQERLARGWLSQEEARREQHERRRLLQALVEYLAGEGSLDRRSRSLASPNTEAAVLRASLAYLARSPAALVLVALEDLWLETRPQNVPGTSDEHPNWRRPARYRFESFRARPQVVGTLKEIDSIRRRAGA